MSSFTRIEDTCLGALGSNLPESEGRETWYISTAIAYMNGYPHIGHAYEFVSADALARLHRVLGYDTWFLLRSLGCSNDDYVRTTEDRHRRVAQELWKMCAASDDIYLHYHEGWYNEREECYVTETDASLTDYKDPATGLEYKKVSEEAYFFRMSKYADRLIAYMEENPGFCQPEGARQELLARLRHPDGLRDVCVSRTTFKWGIPVPEGFDEKHIMYVWFDALSNYLTGVDALGLENGEKTRYWPCNKHIIGKDINHGFVNAADGRKMSKSFNNTINPHDIIAKYPLDTIRYYTLSAATYGADLNFSEPALVTMHNSELADILGNLVHRILNLTHKYCKGVIPDTTHDEAFGPPFNLKDLIDDANTIGNDCALHTLSFRAMEAARATNKFLTDAEPWKMKGDDENRRAPIVRTTLEAVYAFSHFLAPIMPYATEKIFQKLGTPPRALFRMNADFYNLTPGTPVTIGEILFTKIETASTSLEDPNQVDFTKMEIRVGKITKCWNHPAAEKLFCEEIDIGAEVGVREVASGLRAYYEISEMIDRNVLVVCNLKPAKMVGFESAGMVLAAKADDGSKMELVAPPADAAVGERVFLDGVDGEAWSANKVTKKKVWNAVMPDLRTDESGAVVWRGSPVMTSAGPCSVPSLAHSQVA
eukprot:GSChrysophyteH1.ASY1.ANO1.511.1 assembled CDS